MKRRVQDRAESRELLGPRFGWLIASHLIISCGIWPPRALTELTSSYANEQISGEVRSVTQYMPMNVVSWNVQRMGELAVQDRQSVIEDRVRCVTQTILQADQVAGGLIEVFAFQEVSNQSLQRLERALSLQCQFISYHPTRKRRTGGLGICVRSEGAWRLNYVRKIKLDGVGRWRALFAEISARSDPSVNTNIINLHFLPHGIKPRKLRSVLTSPRAAWRLMQSIQDTSIAQRAQARGLLELIQDYRDPTLLMGDFNAPPRMGAHSLLGDQWFDTWGRVGEGSGTTRHFGGVIPLRVDYIYARESGIKARSASVIEPTLSSCSDHYPVIASIEIPRLSP